MIDNSKKKVRFVIMDVGPEEGKVVGGTSQNCGVPSEGNIIIIDSRIYKVTSVIYNYDTPQITVTLESMNKI